MMRLWIIFFGIVLNFGNVSWAMHNLSLSTCEEVSSEDESYSDEEEVSQIISSSVISQALRSDYFDDQEENEDCAHMIKSLHISPGYFESKPKMKKPEISSMQLRRHYMSPECLHKLLQCFQQHDFKKITSRLQKLAACQDCSKKINENIGQTNKTILSHAVIELGKFPVPKKPERHLCASYEVFQKLEHNYKSSIKNIQNAIIQLRCIGADDIKTLGQVSSQGHENLFAFNALAIDLNEYKK